MNNEWQRFAVVTRFVPGCSVGVTHSNDSIHVGRKQYLPVVDITFTRKWKRQLNSQKLGPDLKWNVSYMYRCCELYFRLCFVYYKFSWFPTLANTLLSDNLLHRTNCSSTKPHDLIILCSLAVLIANFSVGDCHWWNTEYQQLVKQIRRLNKQCNTINCFIHLFKFHFVTLHIYLHTTNSHKPYRHHLQSTFWISCLKDTVSVKLWSQTCACFVITNMCLYCDHQHVLAVYQIILGTLDMTASADVEWVYRPYMNTAKKRRFLAVD